MAKQSNSLLILVILAAAIFWLNRGYICSRLVMPDIVEWKKPSQKTSPLYGDRVVRQYFIPNFNGLFRVGFSVGYKEAGQEKIEVSLREADTDRELFNEVILLRKFPKNQMRRFSFPPLWDSAEKSYYLNISTRDTVPETQLRLLYDSWPLFHKMKAGRLFFNDKKLHGELSMASECRVRVKKSDFFSFWRNLLFDKGFAVFYIGIMAIGFVILTLDSFLLRIDRNYDKIQFYDMKRTKILSGILLILLGIILNYKVIVFMFFRQGPLLRKAVKGLISLANLGLIMAGSFLICVRNKKIRFREMRIFLFNTIVFFLLPYLFLEAAVIKLNIIHPPRFKERHRLFYEFLEPDRDLGYKIKPNLHNFEMEWLEGLKANYETDGLGFRNIGNQRDAPLAIVGDSVAFGVGVNYDKSWFRLLSQNLHIPLANYAVGGYHPWQYNWIIRKFIVNYPHRVLFYCIFANDLSNHHRIINNSYRYYEYMGWSDYKSGYPWIRRTVLYTALKKIDQAMERALKYEKERVRIKNGLYLYRVTGAEADYLERRTDLITEHFLRESISLVQDRLQLIVILFPSKESVYREEYIRAFPGFGEDYIENETEGYKRINRFCEEEGLLAYDLTEAFRGIRDDKILFFNEDPHLNEQGNAEVARLLSGKFRDWEKEGLVR